MTTTSSLRLFNFYLWACQPVAMRATFNSMGANGPSTEGIEPEPQPQSGGRRADRGFAAHGPILHHATSVHRVRLALV